MKILHSFRRATYCLFLYGLVWGYTVVFAGEASPGGISSISTSSHYYISRITIDNAKCLRGVLKRMLLGSYWHTFLSWEAIRRLVEKTRAYYIQQGYVTAHVHLVPEQSLSCGVLRLGVMYGCIDCIQLGANTWRDRLRVYFSFPCSSGSTVYMPHLEQGIDQLNSLPSSKATIQILPGKTEQRSIVQINNVVTHPFRVDIGLNNATEDLMKWSIGMDNLVGINDSTTIGGSGITWQEDVQDASGACSINSSFSFGYYTFSGGYNKGSHQVSALKGISYCTKERSKQITLKRLMLQKAGHKLSFSLDSMWKATTPFMGKQKLSIQASKNLLFTGNIHMEGRMFSGQYTGQLSGIRGMEQGSSIPSKTIKPAFHKFSSSLLWQYAWLSRVHLNYQLQYAGQYSLEALPHPEQFSLTGQDHVRGYEKTYTGSRGFFVRNEVALLGTLSSMVYLRPLQVFFGIDTGYSPQVSGASLEEASLTLWSGSVGVKYQYRWLSGNCTFACPLDREGAICKDYQVYWSVSLALHALIKI